MRWLVMLSVLIAVAPAGAQERVPTTVAESIAGPFQYVQQQFLAVAEAMPEERYGFAPTAGEFKGVRTFAEQVKHVACSNHAFFNEIEGKTPPAHCEKGGPSAAGTKKELLAYLQQSFEYSNRVVKTFTPQNLLNRVEGPYAGPNTRLGIAEVAVWHVSDHYVKLVE